MQNTPQQPIEAKEEVSRLSARSKRWAGRRLGIQGEGGGRLAAFLLPSPAHPLPQGQAFNPADSVCAVKAGTGPHIPAGGGVGVGLQTSPEVGEGGAVPSTSAPHSGSCWLLPCPHRRGEPSQTWAGLRAPQLPFQPQPGASPRGHTSPGSARVKAAAERRGLG